MRGSIAIHLVAAAVIVNISRRGGRCVGKNLWISIPLLDHFEGMAPGQFCRQGSVNIFSEIYVPEVKAVSFLPCNSISVFVWDRDRIAFLASAKTIKKPSP